MVGGPTILEGGTAEQIEQFVPATLRGELVWCQLFSEPEVGSGSGLAARKTERRDGGWVLNGQKVWTSAALQSPLGCMSCPHRPRRPPNTKGITYFLVDMRSPGIMIRPLREIAGDGCSTKSSSTTSSCPTTWLSVRSTTAGGWPTPWPTSGWPGPRHRAGQPDGADAAQHVRQDLDPRWPTAWRPAAGRKVGSLLDHRIASSRWVARTPAPKPGALADRGALPAGAREFRMEQTPGGIAHNDAVQSF